MHVGPSTLTVMYRCIEVIEVEKWIDFYSLIRHTDAFESSNNISGAIARAEGDDAWQENDVLLDGIKGRVP